MKRGIEWKFNQAEFGSYRALYENNEFQRAWWIMATWESKGVTSAVKKWRILWRMCVDVRRFVIVSNCVWLICLQKNVIR